MLRLVLAVTIFGAPLVAHAQTPARAVPCDPDNGGLQLPAGFCAIRFAANVIGARHLTVAPNGDVLVATRPRGTPNSPPPQPGVMLLRDTDGDGRADLQQRITTGSAGTGIGLSGGYLYATSGNSIVRYRYTIGSTEPLTAPETVVTNLPMQGHSSHNFVVHGGDLFVNIGSRSNSCQQADRQANSPGHDPCTELETRAGVWRFAANRLRQQPSDGRRYATGIRNALALARHPGTGRLYAVVHGRDQLFDNWKPMFTEQENAEKPSEELIQINEGDDFGWPYCYHDPALGRRVTAPEYGGDGRSASRCGRFKAPLFGYPAHWAPNGLTFYTGSSFPTRYRNGAFIAFHGSWNRAPLPQAGFNVVFQPMTADGRLDGAYTVFADGFMATEARTQARVTAGGRRPTGVAVGPDGALFVSDDLGGTIWRIQYRGGVSKDR